jgi:hypothetical protein
VKLAYLLKEGRSEDCSAFYVAEKTDLILCTESPKSELTDSDALIVKSYAMSAPKAGSVIPLGGGSAAADESKTR